MYHSVEHAYQAAKTLELADRVRLAETASPGAVKRLGELLNKRPDWKEVKYFIMLDLVRQKFDGRDPWLRKELLLTGGAYLQEGNTWGDQYWGTVNGVGENHLGFILMKIRSEITYKATHR
jgi:hypothetical protein